MFPWLSQYISLFTLKRRTLRINGMICTKSIDIDLIGLAFAVIIMCTIGCTASDTRFFFCIVHIFIMKTSASVTKCTTAGCLGLVSIPSLYSNFSQFTTMSTIVQAVFYITYQISHNIFSFIFIYTFSMCKKGIVYKPVLIVIFLQFIHIIHFLLWKTFTFTFVLTNTRCRYLNFI